MGASPAKSRSSADPGLTGIAFQLSAEDEYGDPVLTFNKPFTITVNFSEPDWQDAGIVNESSLYLAYWDGGSADWIDLLPCVGCSLDKANKTLRVNFDKTADFALLGEVLAKIYLPLVLR